MKRSLAALVAMALIATACGGDDDADSSADTTTTSAVVETTEAPTTTGADDDMDDDMMDENIVEVAAGAGSFTTLLAAAEAAGLVDTLQGDGPFTVFAPTDDAFAALPAGTLDDLLANPEALSQVLLYHVVPGKVLAADVVGLDSATTVEGSDIAITVSDGTVMVDNATVVTTDIEASNGVIHVIDAVILPASLQAMGA